MSYAQNVSQARQTAAMNKQSLVMPTSSNNATAADTISVSSTGRPGTGSHHVPNFGVPSGVRKVQSSAFVNTDQTGAKLQTVKHFTTQKINQNSG